VRPSTEKPVTKADDLLVTMDQNLAKVRTINAYNIRQVTLPTRKKRKDWEKG